MNIPHQPLRPALLIGPVIFAVALAVFSQEHPPAGNPTKSADPAVERGSQSFADNCAVCHGDDATGGRGPDLTHAKSIQQDKNGDVVGPILKNGIPDKGMPSLGLTDEEISDLVAFLHSKAAGQPSKAGPCPDSPAVAPGNAELGKAYFDGKCASCHSASTDLEGIAAKYSAPDLQTRVVCPQGKNPAATVTLTTGEKYSGIVTQSDDSKVVINDPAGRTHTWPKTSVRIETPDPATVHQQALAGHSSADLDNLLAFLETLK